MLTEKKLNEKHALTEVWVTHHALDASEPEHQWLDGVSKTPWGADYKAPITDWAANTRYVRADIVDARDEVIKGLVEALEDVTNGENWRMGQKFDANSGSFDLSVQRAALAAAKAVQHG